MFILVVEDDCLINLMTSDDLQKADYEVISAYNADEAIKMLEGRSDIRLVFTDIDMPGSMDGLELAAIVKDRWHQSRSGDKWQAKSKRTTRRGVFCRETIPSRACSSDHRQPSSMHCDPLALTGYVRHLVALVQFAVRTKQALKSVNPGPPSLGSGVASARRA